MINEKNKFWLWAGWVASYLQRSLSAQVNGGSRCHPWPLKIAIFCGQEATLVMMHLKMSFHIAAHNDPYLSTCYDQLVVQTSFIKKLKE